MPDTPASCLARVAMRCCSKTRLRATNAGAHRYGEVLGVGAASAAVSINQWPDQPEPLVRAMRAALDDAQIAAEDVGVVYASANGAARLDDLEARALAECSAAAGRSSRQSRARSERAGHRCGVLHCGSRLRGRGAADSRDRSRCAQRRRPEHRDHAPACRPAHMRSSTVWPLAARCSASCYASGRRDGLTAQCDTLDFDEQLLRHSWASTNSSVASRDTTCSSASRTTGACMALVTCTRTSRNVRRA